MTWTQIAYLSAMVGIVLWGLAPRLNYAEDTLVRIAIAIEGLSFSTDCGNSPDEPLGEPFDVSLCACAACTDECDCPTPVEGE